MIAKKKSEEKYVTLCFAVLAEFLRVVEEGEEGQASGGDGVWEELVELLSSSCLLPAMAGYLVNDSGEGNGGGEGRGWMGKIV